MNVERLLLLLGDDFDCRDEAAIGAIRGDMRDQRLQSASRGHFTCARRYRRYYADIRRCFEELSNEEYAPIATYQHSFIEK